MVLPCLDARVQADFDLASFKVCQTELRNRRGVVATEERKKEVHLFERLLQGCLICFVCEFECSSPRSFGQIR